MPNFSSDVRFKKGLRGPGWATPEYYGAKGSLGVNDGAAFADMLADLSTSGGRVLLGPKQYRVDGLLSWPGNISMSGVPDVSYLVLNHATDNGLVFVDYNVGPPAVISDVRFTGLIANTGTCLVNNSDARVQFVRCAWNGFDAGGAASSNLRGKIASLNSAGSEFEFIDSRLNVVDTARGVDLINGQVKITRGVLSMPASYGNGIVYVGATGRATLDNVTLDGSLTTTGNGNFIFASNGSDVSLLGNRLLAGSTANGKSMLGWNAGARVTEVGTVIGSTPAMVKYSSSARLAAFSSLDLVRHVNANTAGVTYTVPDGVRTFALQCLGAGMALTMPAILFNGQELDISLFASGGSFGASILGYGLKATQPTVTNNTGITARFVALDPNTSGTTSWVQVGDWASVLA